MTKLRVNKNKDVIASMFLPAAVAMIFSTVAGFLASTIDGLITSNFLGPDAFSAISLFNPMVSLMLLFTYFIAVGGQVICSEKIGAGEKKEANAIFSFSVTVGIVFSTIFVLLGVLAPDVIFRICGITSAERPEIHAFMSEYLRGYVFGIPSFIMVQVLSSFLIIDNGKKVISVAAAVLCVSDIVLDVVNVIVLKGGVFGMGLATAISLTLQLIVLLSHFVLKSRYFRFSLNGFHLEFLKSIINNGALNFMRSLATSLRELFTNHLNLAVAVGTAAIAARGIQGDINRLMFCIGIGMGKAVLPMVSMYFGADDRNGMRRIFAYSMKTTAVISGGAGAVLFILAPIVARAYTHDPEIITLAVFAIRCMAVGLVFDAVLVAYQNYIQGIKRFKLANFICFAERFFIPVIVVWVLGRTFGSRGVLASIAVGKVVLVVLILLAILIYRRGIPKKWENYMVLPEDFGIEEGAELCDQIRTIEDAVRCSRDVGDFCRTHGIDSKKANLMSLFVEEMAGNIISHGKPKKRNDISVDFRLFVKDDRLCLTLRDYCEVFDPVKYYEIHREGEPEQNLGIRMVMKLAEDIRYINSFNTNCIMISIWNSHN